MAKKAEPVGTKKGKKAPEFALVDQQGATRKLSDSSGRTTVLFFYCKDGSIGCTKEVAGFEQRTEEFAKLGVGVVGITTGPAKDKKKFAARDGIALPLLADEDNAVAVKYGVWKEKSMYGNLYMGVSRETFVVGPNGKIIAHWDKVVANEQHAGDVLEWLKEHDAKK